MFLTGLIHSSSFIFPRKIQKVCLQNILIDDPHIVIFLQGIFQDRNQLPVDLNGSHAVCRFAQILCQRPDARTDLEDHILFSDFRCLQRAEDHTFVHQKVLTEAFPEIKIIL